MIRYAQVLFVAASPYYSNGLDKNQRRIDNNLELHDSLSFPGCQPTDVAIVVPRHSARDVVISRGPIRDS